MKAAIASIALVTLLVSAWAPFNPAYSRAIPDFNKAIEINPKFAEAYTNRGTAYDVRGEYDKAISDYSEAIEIDPLMQRSITIGGLPIAPKGNTIKLGRMCARQKVWA